MHSASVRSTPPVIATVLILVLLLIGDGDRTSRQILLLVSASLYLYWLSRGSRRRQTEAVGAILLALIAEPLFSLGLRLYTYRHAMIPFYVLPGHAIVYLAARDTAACHAFRRHDRALVLALITAGSAIVIAGILSRRDVSGAVLWLWFLLFISCSANKLLLGACLLYTLPLEWLGTAIGNWQWSPEVPLLGLTSANPPAGVAAFYALLDLFLPAFARALMSARARVHIRYSNRRG